MSPKAEKLQESHSHHPTPQLSSAACSTQPGSGHALLETLGAGCLWGRVCRCIYMCVCGTRVHARFSSSFSFQATAQGGAEYRLRVRTQTLDFALAKMEWGHEVARGESSEFLLHNWQVERNSFWRLNPGQEHGTPFEVAEGPEPICPRPITSPRNPSKRPPAAGKKPPGRAEEGTVEAERAEERRPSLRPASSLGRSQSLRAPSPGPAPHHRLPPAAPPRPVIIRLRAGGAASAVGVGQSWSSPPRPRHRPNNQTEKFNKQQAEGLVAAAGPG